MICFEEICSLSDIKVALDEKHKLTVGDPSIKIVAFHSHYILFACLIEGPNDGSIQTLFARISIIDKSVTDVYVHPDPIDVLGASVSPEMNMLIFARRSASKGVTSKAFLVDLVNTKLFDVQIENSYHQQLTFLPWRNARERDKRREHFVFFVEKRQLGVLHIMTTENEEGAIEIQQIQKEVLVQHYVWYQLDLHSMRLYYIYLQQHETTGRMSEEERSQTVSSMFNVYQFSTHSHAQLTLSVKLPLPISPELYTVSNRCSIGPTSFSLPDCRVTTTVLRSGDGLVLCIAYSGKYWIYVVHSGYLVECPYGEEGQPPPALMFMDIAGYTIVYSPAGTLHCIDASTDHCIQANMVFPAGCSTGPTLSAEQCIQRVGHNTILSPVPLPGGQGVFVNQHTLYRVAVREEQMLRLYRGTQCRMTWSFLLHVAISHLSNTKLAHKMIIHSITTGGYTAELFKEYLLSAPLRSLQEKINPMLVSALPYTPENSKVGVLAQNRKLTITNVKQTVTKVMLSAQKFENVVVPSGPYIRFNLEDFVSKSEPSVADAGGPGCGGSVYSSSYHTSSSSVSGEHSAGSSNGHAEEDELLAERVSNALGLHLHRRFNETLTLRQCEEAASKYMSAQSRHCALLLALALISAGKEPGWQPEALASDTEEYSELVRVLDKLKLVFLQLGCPTPPNFDWVHLYTAFKSLPGDQLQRRLASKSLKLSSTAVQRFLTDIPEDPVCGQLVALLPRTQAMEILKKWETSACRSFYTQYHLFGLRSKFNLSGPPKPATETPLPLKVHPFIPVNSFYSYLYHKIAEETDKTPDEGKLATLCEVSLEETRRRLGDAALSRIAF